MTLVFSIVESEPYLVELVRYLHLNPLRMQDVPDLRALDRYPWSGHGALLGSVAHPWQDTATILGHFGPTSARARWAYRAFVAAGIPQGRRPELQGGGLLRSQGGWAAVAELRRGREAYLGDERILGSSDFVEQVRQELQKAGPPAAQRRLLTDLIACVCAATGSSPPPLQQGSRGAAVARGREGIAYLAVELEGHTGRSVADALGVPPRRSTGPPSAAAPRTDGGTT